VATEDREDVLSGHRVCEAVVVADVGPNLGDEFFFAVSGDFGVAAWTARAYGHGVS
jgi:hypothetical protein